jgi:hypothetical protein
MHFGPQQQQQHVVSAQIVVSARVHVVGDTGWFYCVFTTAVCPTARLPDCPTARLPDCPTARLPDCPSVRPSVRPVRVTPLAGWPPVHSSTGVDTTGHTWTQPDTYGPTRPNTTSTPPAPMQPPGRTTRGHARPGTTLAPVGVWYEACAFLYTPSTRTMYQDRKSEERRHATDIGDVRGQRAGCVSHSSLSAAR